TRIGRRDRALLMVGFAAALRRSELVALDVPDLGFTADGLELALGRTKTDQEEQGVRAGVPFGSDRATCPVRALRAWLEDAAMVEGAVFRSVSRHGRLGGRLSDRDVARIVRRTALRGGLDPSRYTGHSLRAGLAPSAAKAGKRDRAIMKQGRWRSRAMVDRYVRDAPRRGERRSRDRAVTDDVPPLSREDAYRVCSRPSWAPRPCSSAGRRSRSGQSCIGRRLGCRSSIPRRRVSSAVVSALAALDLPQAAGAPVSLGVSPHPTVRHALMATSGVAGDWRRRERRGREKNCAWSVLWTAIEGVQGKEVT
ncbi:MAG: site-specific integrase, partial [Sandaracinaceae bacterium]|nr:site-specific integrase [Sandaracinaceae bacterium]